MLVVFGNVWDIRVIFGVGCVFIEISMWTRCYKGVW